MLCDQVGLPVSLSVCLCAASRKELGTYMKFLTKVDVGPVSKWIHVGGIENLYSPHNSDNKINTKLYNKNTKKNKLN